MPLKLTEFDASAYLDSEEVIAEYLTAALEDEDPDAFLTAVGNVAKAHGMTQIAQATGIESLAGVPGLTEAFRAMIRAQRDPRREIMATPVHLTMEELEASLDEIRASPKQEGILKLIVRRPQIGEREALQQAELDRVEGLMGDNWRTRGSSRTPDGSSHPDMQINIMNSRTIALIAQRPERWQLAGDQLFIDLDLSAENLPPGIRLALGSAVLEVTSQPHTGCKKFVERFGADALKLVNSPVGRQLNLRGINAKIVQPGVIRVGDLARKIPR